MEVSQLKAVIKEMKKHTKKIVLFGQSLGASISILSYNKNVNGLVLLAPGIYLKKIFKKILEKSIIGGLKKLKEEKSAIIIRRLTKEKRKIGLDFWKSVLKKKKVSKKEIEKIKCPTLIFHGTDDKTVDYSESVYLYKTLKTKNKKLILIENAPHVIIRNNVIRNFVIDEVKEFLDKTL